MTTELGKHIMEVSNKIEDLYGEYYSKQYEYAINNIQNNTNIETTHIIVDILDLTIDDDYKQKQINSLKKNVKNLQEEVIILKEDNKLLKEDNKLLKEDNKLLKEDNKLLKEDNKQKDIKINKLEKEIKVLIDDKQQFDALVKLHECNSLVNKEFKRLYRIKFNKKKYDNNVPNIGDFIINPPDPNEESEIDDYNFWIEFNTKYPDSDNISFRTIYQQIANDRSEYGAHINVNRLTKKEFDDLIELAYPKEYNLNKKTYEEYRDWLFMFPV
jgi:hypothetical protein